VLKYFARVTRNYVQDIYVYVEPDEDEG